jgi:hypothetical protein
MWSLRAFPFLRREEDLQRVGCAQLDIFLQDFTRKESGNRSEWEFGGTLGDARSHFSFSTLPAPAPLFCTDNVASSNPQEGAAATTEQQANKTMRDPFESRIAVLGGCERLEDRAIERREADQHESRRAYGSLGQGVRVR